MTEWHNGRGQSGTMDSDKVARTIGTYTNQREQQKLTSRKSTRSKQKTTRPTYNKSSYREDFKDSNDWLESQSADFQKQVREYLEYNCNSPKVKYPHAMRMYIIVEICKKYNNKTNHTDFQYINKEELKPSNREEITFTKKKNFEEGFESEMEKLHLQGEA